MENYKIIKISWYKKMGVLNQRRSRKKAIFYTFLKEIGYIDQIPNSQFEAKMVKYENTM